VEPASAGSLALWGAIAAASASLILPQSWSRRLIWAAVSFSIIATLVLTLALLTGDFSLAYVAKTTSLATPWPYRISALWGGMEGSLLFYATLLLTFGVAGTRLRVDRWVVTFVGLGLLLLTALASDPFRRLDIPAVNGDGLLAILQHPAMIYHPPVLYLGLTTLVVPFAITVGAVMRGETGRAWSTDVRRWLTWSWLLLTVGMVAGANWAYVELGWGGFWAWDPVENTSLLPWLAATVFFHTSRLTDRDDRLRRWTVFMAMFPFGLSVLGVYLTRSGVTGSIHAFAEDPVIGRILLSAAVATMALVVLLTWRVPRGTSWAKLDASRSAWLWVSAATVSAATGFVLVGSAYPAYLQVFWDRTVVVDARFFVVTILPLAFVIALLIGFALETTWASHGLRRSSIYRFVTGAALALLLIPMIGVTRNAAGLGLAATSAGALVALARPGRNLAGRLAHCGIAMVLIGAGASSMGTEFEGTMSPGDSVMVGPETVQLVSIATGEADRFIYAEGAFAIEGGPVLRPQIRAYEEQARPVSEPALWSTPARDLIIAVSVLSPDAETLEVTVLVRPMVWWVWFGALAAALGGIVSLGGRAGVGAGPRRLATTGPQSEGTTIGRTDR
jgi:cytochrome c-type biogenesis protein CcmF